MEIVFRPFSQLTNEELYAVLRLRSEVFVVEQNCAYLDLDDCDQKAMHLLGFLRTELAACARIFAPGDYFDGYASIGRIATSPRFRNLGYGKRIVTESLMKISELYGSDCPVKIGAQAYLTRFYKSLGFTSTQEEYIEDGIPHVYMMK
ncbi:GNAT family N-acetyltransferase [Reichenbachiella sp. MALMAid0571]|uniref:GNAT family N-acetyltransferase n=1 Tax=Reichenbachiella sp. MALMAid0571 TaxID=3143939 RepID=UPI0032DFC492